MGIQAARAASLHPACATLLLSEEEIEKQTVEAFTTYGNDSKRLQKLAMKIVLKFRKGKLKKRLTELCAHRGGCSKEKLAELMSQELEGLTQASKNLKHIFSMVILGSVVAIAEPHVSKVLPEAIQGWSRVFSIGLVAGVAALTKPAKSSIEQLIEESTISKDALDKTQADNNRRMIKSNQKSNALYSESGRKGTERISDYLVGWIRPTMKELRAQWRRPASAERDAEAIDSLVELALQSRTLYNEIYDKNQQAEESVNTSTYMLFVQYLNPSLIPKWKTRILAELKRRDVETAEPSVQTYYEHMLDVWFKSPEAPHPSKDDGYDGEI